MSGLRSLSFITRSKSKTEKSRSRSFHDAVKQKDASKQERQSFAASRGLNGSSYYVSGMETADVRLKKTGTLEPIIPVDDDGKKSKRQTTPVKRRPLTFGMVPQDVEQPPPKDDKRPNIKPPTPAQMRLYQALKEHRDMVDWDQHDRVEELAVDDEDIHEDLDDRRMKLGNYDPLGKHVRIAGDTDSQTFDAGKKLYLYKDEKDEDRFNQLTTKNVGERLTRYECEVEGVDLSGMEEDAKDLEIKYGEYIKSLDRIPQRGLGRFIPGTYEQELYYGMVMRASLPDFDVAINAKILDDEELKVLLRLSKRHGRRTKAYKHAQVVQSRRQMAIDRYNSDMLEVVVPDNSQLEQEMVKETQRRRKELILLQQKEEAIKRIQQEKQKKQEETTWIKKTPRDMKRGVNLMDPDLEPLPEPPLSARRKGKVPIDTAGLEAFKKEDIALMREKGYFHCSEVEVVGVERWMFYYHLSFSPTCIIDGYVGNELMLPLHYHDDAKFLYKSKSTQHKS
jgi:hypothetical protein